MSHHVCRISNAIYGHYLFKNQITKIYSCFILYLEQLVFFFENFAFKTALSFDSIIFRLEESGAHHHH